MISGGRGSQSCRQLIPSPRVYLDSKAKSKRFREASCFRAKIPFK